MGNDQSADATEPGTKAVGRRPRRAPGGPLPELVSRSLAMRRVCEQLQQMGPRVRLALIEGEAGTGKHLLARHIQVRHASPGLLVVEEATELVFARERQRRTPLRTPPGRRSQSGRGGPADSQHRRIGGRASGAAVALHSLLRNFFSAEKPGASGVPLPVDLHGAQAAASAGARGSVFAGNLLSFERRFLLAAALCAIAKKISRHWCKCSSTLFPGSSRDRCKGSVQVRCPILLRHLWPGNVRELESVIRAACLSGEGQWLRPIDLVILPLEPAGSKDGEPALPENFTLDGVIRRHILLVLKVCDGNKARAASKLGISRSTLYRMLEADIALPMQAPEVKARGSLVAAPSISHHD